MVDPHQLRQQYLAAIGITSWLPRSPLPGAAPSGDWITRFSEEPAVDEGADAGFEADYPAPEPARSVPAAHATASVARPTGAKAAAGRAALAQLDDLSAPSAARATAPEPAAKPAVAELPAAARARPTPLEAPPSLKLAFVVAGDLLVIDSLPVRAPQGFSPAHQRLLNGVVQALGIQHPLSAPVLLSWPMLASQTLDQGPAQALQAVQRKLDLTLQAQPLRRALILGDSAARWVLDREEELDALRGIRFTLRHELPAVCSCSLSQLLQLPELKAELWRDIQPLVRPA